jgi:hypothetical protein
MNDVNTAELPISERDRLREIIRSEVAKANPIDDARRPVELIVETSVRLAGNDGRTLEVIDEKGHLRTGMTIQDVLKELRAKHPTLFKPHEEAQEEPGASISPAHDQRDRPGITVADAPTVQPAATLIDTPPPPRDWLIIGAGPRSRRDVHEAAPSASFGEIAHERREALGRLAQDLRSRFGSAAETVATGLHTARGNVADTLDDVQHEVFRNPSRRLKAGHVLGALGGVLALALVAYFVYSIASLPFGNGLAGRTRTAEAPTSEPGETGTVSAGSTATANTSPPVQNGPVQGVPEVLDTATLWLQGKIVHLYGVEWVRGGGDPEEFTRYLRGREVMCTPVENVDAYRCKVDGKDLSEVVLFNGGGRTTPNAPPDLRAAEEKAKTAKLGVWNK